jgi:hypothetical protein
MRRNLCIGQDPHRAQPEYWRIGVLRRSAKMISNPKSWRIDTAQFSKGSDSDHGAVKMR